MNVKQIQKRVKEVAECNYLVNRKIIINMSCGKAIIKIYKQAMHPVVAERRAYLAIKSHINKCSVCKSKRS